LIQQNKLNIPQLCLKILNKNMTVNIKRHSHNINELPFKRVKMMHNHYPLHNHKINGLVPDEQTDIVVMNELEKKMKKYYKKILLFYNNNKN
jgi:hypothetical protein